MIAPPSRDIGGSSVPIRSPAEPVATSISVMVSRAAVGAGIRRAPHICDNMDGNISIAPNTTAIGSVRISDIGSETEILTDSLDGQYCINRAQEPASRSPEKSVAVVLANGGVSSLLRNRDKLNPQQKPAAIAHQSPILFGTGSEKPPPSRSQTPISAAVITAN